MTSWKESEGEDRERDRDSQRERENRETLRERDNIMRKYQLTSFPGSLSSVNIFKCSRLVSFLLSRPLIQVPPLPSLSLSLVLSLLSTHSIPLEKKVRSLISLSLFHFSLSFMLDSFTRSATSASNFQSFHSRGSLHS